MTTPQTRIPVPPLPRTQKGEPRRVGVEIEFGELPLEDAAQIVASLFGGQIERHERFLIDVSGTSAGTFTLELDTQYAHSSEKLTASEKDSLSGRLKTGLQEAFGEVTKAVVPNEITCPPIPYDRLHLLDELTGELARHGACGTKGSPFYAFGLQLNPEVAKKDAPYILAHLRAFCLLRDWLRREIDVDITRRILPFAAPFERDYIEHILNPGYAPSLAELTGDYMRFNPTRNRELDLLPLFAHLDEKRVRTVMKDSLIKARPTFHYRLPDSHLGQSQTPVTDEWRRWLAVEYLAADEDLTASLSARYLARPYSPEDWAEETAETAARLLPA